MKRKRLCTDGRHMCMMESTFSLKISAVHLAGGICLLMFANYTVPGKERKRERERERETEVTSPLSRWS